MGRRTSLASLAGQKVDSVPGQSDPLLLTLPLEKLVPTRFNPRRNFGSEGDLRDFGEKLRRRQLQPAVVVSRSAYLRLWPEEAEHIGPASFVIANGERRYRGSLAAGMTTLNVVHNEDVANSRADFLDAILSENNDREDLDPIERAIGIETMVVQLGGADKVAQHYEKSKGWVSQQRKLLALTPELQALVSSGEIPIRVARDIAGLPAAEQAAAWSEEQQRRAAAQGVPRSRKPKAVAGEPGDRQRAAAGERDRGSRPAGATPTPAGPVEPERFTAVNRPGAAAALAGETVDELSGGVPAGEGSTATMPHQSAPAGADGLWADPERLCGHIIEVMSRADRRRLASLLLTYNAQETEAETFSQADAPA
ncbi:ParB/RepB/Spo0J family partition protein [Streptomyces jumonjinensis]|uniref:ParB/RepB/Spo0J family partition protein n=1 Tax=Streptomyces jumonjinensis TaxID=1945 RepID=UPI003789357E